MVQWDDNDILLFKANSLKVKREEHLVMLVSLINAKHWDMLSLEKKNKFQLFLLDKTESGFFLGFAQMESEQKGHTGPSMLLKLLPPLWFNLSTSLCNYFPSS